MASLLIGQTGNDMCIFMKKTLVQIYEVQEPDEAEALIALGVDHIGSVLLSQNSWKAETIRETVQTIQQAGAKSGLIPLFGNTQTIFQALDYYRPDFVHFCDAIPILPGIQKKPTREYDAFITLQVQIKDRFPQIKIMRSISVPKPCAEGGSDVLNNILSFTKLLVPFSDYFLIDTIIGNHGLRDEQPVAGYVGITGEVCDWHIADKIIKQSPIPVILAGGISDENVFEAIIKLRPAGVDSCTKTNAVDKEDRPIRFTKDLKKVKRMVEEARRADATMAQS
jgi:phosphoribosylanthranilate isomerase